MITRAVQSLAKNCKNCEGVTSYSMFYTDDLDKAPEEYGYSPRYSTRYYRQDRIDDSVQLGGVGFSRVDYVQWYRVGSTLEQIEKAYPKIGQTLLDILWEAGRKAFGIITPFVVGGLAENHYWMGEHDEKCREEEERDEFKHWCEANKQQFTEEEFRNQITIFRRADLEHGVPQWAFRPTELKEFPRRLHKLSPPVRRAVEIAEDLRSKAKALPHSSSSDHGWIECPSEFRIPWILRWSKADNFDQVVDDVDRSEQESGEHTDIAYLRIFDWNKPAEVQAALRDLPKVFEIIGLMHQIIKRIGVRL